MTGQAGDHYQRHQQPGAPRAVVADRHGCLGSNGMGVVRIHFHFCFRSVRSGFGSVPLRLLFSGWVFRLPSRMVRETEHAARVCLGCHSAPMVAAGDRQGEIGDGRGEGVRGGSGMWKEGEFDRLEGDEHPDSSLDTVRGSSPKPPENPPISQPSLQERSEVREGWNASETRGRKSGKG